MSFAIPSFRGAIAVPGWAKNELWRKARAVPSLDLRFADSKSLVDATTGSSLVTFTRASSGTFVDSARVIQTAAIDEPCFDHNPITGESLGLLVEEQRTNLLLRSEEFDNAVWVNIGGTVTRNVNTEIAPNGTLTADKLVFPGANVGAAQIITVVSDATYTFSVWIKGVAGETINVIGGGNVTLSDQWTRFILTGYLTSTTITLNLSTFGDATARNIYVWGAQLEAGASPTSYIPTTSAAVTRNASLADLISGAIANNIRSFYVEFSSPAVGTRGVVSLNDNTANERASVLTSGTDPRLVVQDGGVEQANINGGTVAAGVRTRVAVRIGADDFAISINGGAVVTDTSGTLPTVDRLMFGRTQAGEYLNGRIARFTGWSQLLPNATLQILAQ